MSMSPEELADQVSWFTGHCPQADEEQWRILIAAPESMDPELRRALREAEGHEGQKHIVFDYSETVPCVRRGGAVAIDGAMAQAAGF